MMPHLKTCRSCLMKQIVKESFKYDRKRKRLGSTRVRSSCYVDGYSRQKVSEICAKFNGKCFYTGLPIEIGSTAGLDHAIPVSRARSWGEAAIYSADNLVWAHKAINYMKGDRTSDEFIQWLKDKLPDITCYVSGSMK